MGTILLGDVEIASFKMADLGSITVLSHSLSHYKNCDFCKVQCGWTGV